MKKLQTIMAAALLALGTVLHAQTTDTNSIAIAPPANFTDTITITVNGNKIIILADKIANLNGAELSAAALEIIMLSKDLLQNAQDEVARIQKEVNAGQLTQTEAEERTKKLETLIENQMTEIANKVAAAAEIEFSVGDDEADIEKWIADWFDDGDIDDGALDFINPKKSRKQAKKLQEKLRTYGSVDINWGLSSLLDAEFFIPSGNDELNTWGSNQFAVAFSRVNTLGPNRSLFKLKYGLAFQWNKYTLDGRYIWQQNTNVTEVVPFELPTKSASLHVNYLTVPVMLLFDTSRNIKNKKGFILGAGGYFGVRTRSRTRVSYTDLANNEVFMRTKGHFFLNDFKYGIMAQAGVGNFRITAEYDLNNFFRDGRGEVYNRAAITIGWEL